MTMIVSYIWAAVLYIINGFVTLFLASLFYRRMEKSDYYSVKLGFGLAALCAVSFLFAIYKLLGWESSINYVFYTVILVLPYFIVLLCYRVRKMNMFICHIAALVFLLAAKRAVELLIYIFSLTDAPEIFLSAVAEQIYFVVLSVLIYIVLRLTCDKVFEFVLRTPMPRRTVFLPVLIAFMNLLFGVISPRVRALGDSLYVVLVYIFEITYCSLFFILFMYFVTSIRAVAKNIVLEDMFVRYEKQYKRFEQDIRIINQKSHDLRFRVTASADEETEKALSEYESHVDTGNALLDVIITDMGYRCAENKIQFTCSADGKLLSYVNETDMCALFGNAYENAVEYLVTRPVDERFISTTLKRRGDMAHLHIENAFSGQLRLKNGMPETTKSDKDVHGFGVQSICRIAEKYGGSAEVTIADAMFQLDIIFPLSNSCNNIRSF